MNCPNCGARLEEGCRFCMNCGTPITIAEKPRQEFCSNCGNALSVGSAFCEICGTPVSSAGVGAGAFGSPSKTANMNPVTFDGSASAPGTYGEVLRSGTGGSRSAYRSSDASDAGKQGLGAGAIAGIIVGAVVVVAVVALGVAFALGAFNADDGNQESSSTTTEQNDDQSSDGSAGSDNNAEEKSSNEIEVKAKIADYSWSDLVKIADKIEAEAKTRDDAIKMAASYNLVKSDGTMTGDTKTLDTGVGSTDVLIADVYVDKLSSSSSKCAAFTFVGADILTTHAMNATATNTGGWAKTGMRTWLNGTVLDSFPTDLSKATKQVVKMTNNTGKTQSTSSVTQSTDKVWLLSWMECLGPISWNEGADTSYIDNIDNQEGVQYAWFKQQGVAGKQGHEALVRSARGSSEEGVWWMRSSAPNTSTSFGDMGPEIDNGGTASTPEGVVIGFCL